MSLIEQVKAATELAQQAFARGDKVTGAAALVFAAQLLQLARLLPENKGDVRDMLATLPANSVH